MLQRLVLAQPGGLRTLPFPWEKLNRRGWESRENGFRKLSGRARTGESMKVLLRNIVTGHYYQGPNQWTPDVAAALDLKQTSKAVQLAFETHLDNVEVVLV